MDAPIDGTQTHGRKGPVYDWQQLLVPEEPGFTEELDRLTNDDSVVAESL